MSSKERIIYIDYLKVIGLFLVILAHVDCPRWLMQLRSFDVPLLVFVSGYLSSYSYESGKYKEYYKKRFVRLVFPTWIFLIIFFIIQSLVYIKPTIIDIIKGFTFQKDANMVGMLWVIWVYLICAMIIPILKKINFSYMKLIFISFILIIYEISCILTNWSDNRYVYMTFMTIVPWGWITYIGFFYNSMDKKCKNFLWIFLLSIFLIISLLLYCKNNMFIGTYEFKYPARIYYISYALCWVMFLFRLLKNIHFKENKCIEFISTSSLWIYLWHILLVYVVKKFIINDELWLIQYLFIIFGAISITYIQNKIIKKIMRKYNMIFLKIFLG